MRLFFLVLLLANLAAWFWRDDVAAWLAPRLEPAPAPQVRGDAPPPLVLLAEREGEAASPPATPTDAPTRSAAASLCLEIGPWADPDQAADALAAAGEAGVTASLVREERAIPTGYWVLSPVRYDLAGARAAMRELEERGIEDLAIVSLDDGHAVSLGIFSRASAMERRRREFTDIGYPPDVRRRSETRPVDLLVIERRAADDAPVESLLERLGQTDPALQWRERPCAALL